MKYDNTLTFLNSIYRPGTFKGLTIIGEKTHNKNVTRISGLEPFLFNIPRLVNKWQLLFACSVSTQVVKEKTSEKTVNREIRELKT